MEPTWHDGLSRKALVDLLEALLGALDKAVPRLDAVAHHLSLISQQGGENEILGGISDQVADIGDELYAASDRDKLREWGNEIDTPDKAELIAANMSVPEIAKAIGVDSLGYISLDGMLESVPGGPTGFCDACFSGRYPTAAPTIQAKLRMG